MSVFVLPCITISVVACWPVFDALCTFFDGSNLNMLLMLSWFICLSSSVPSVSALGRFLRFATTGEHAAGSYLFIGVACKVSRSSEFTTSPCAT